MLPVDALLASCVLRTQSLLLYLFWPGTLLTPEDCSSTFSSVGDCLDPASYPTPEGRFYAMSALYWEFGLTLGIVEENPGLEAVRALVDQKCEKPEVCDGCSDTDCFEVR